MFGHLIKHKNITGIESGAKITTSIPALGVHAGLYLRCLTAAGVELTAAEIMADIKDVTISISGVDIINVDAAFLLARQQYYGGHIDAMNVTGILPMMYTRPYLPTPQQQLRTALGMQGEDSYTIEMDLADPLVKLAKIEVYVDRLPISNPLGEHIVIKRRPQNYSTVAGMDEISNLPGQGDRFKAHLAMHVMIDKASCGIEKCQVIANSHTIFAAAPVSLNKVMLERAGRTPQTAFGGVSGNVEFYHIDYTIKNELRSRLKMSNIVDYRQQVTFNGSAAPAAYSIYMEYLENLNADDSDGFQAVA